MNFTLLFVGAMLMIVVVTANSTVSLIESARNEMKSLQAFYAADSGIECASFLSSRYHAFDTTSTSSTYSCGIGTSTSFTAGGGSSPPSDCVAKTYDIPIEGFENGACTTLDITVVPRKIMIDGVNHWVCDLQVFSYGKSSCDPDAVNVSERTRWKNM